MCHEVALEFFVTKAPDPLRWTLNSCFAAFRMVWVHLRLFGCLTKLGAKHFELVQKFVPRRRVRVFRDERTRSSPLDPKHMLWCVSYHLHAFGTVRLPYKTRGKTFRISVKFLRRSRVGVFHDECTRSTPLDPNLMFWCISYHLGAFGTVWLPYETRCKTGRTSAKLRATKAHRNFSQPTHSIHPHWTLI